MLNLLTINKLRQHLLRFVLFDTDYKTIREDKICLDNLNKCRIILFIYLFIYSFSVKPVIKTPVISNHLPLKATISDPIKGK